MLFSNLNEIGFLIFEKKGEEKFPQIEDNSRNAHPILEKIIYTSTIYPSFKEICSVVLEEFCAQIFVFI
mgnify:CR=1 FL=1